MTLPSLWTQHRCYLVSGQTSRTAYARWPPKKDRTLLAKAVAMEQMPLDEAATARFESVRGVRRQLAYDADLPPYAVASDGTLRELVTAMPRCHEDLLAIHGNGQTRVERYGTAFLLAMARASSGYLPSREQMA